MDWSQTDILYFYSGYPRMALASCQTDIFHDLDSIPERLEYFSVLEAEVEDPTQLK